MNIQRLSLLKKEYDLLSEAMSAINQAKELDIRPYPLDKIAQALKEQLANVVKDAGECAVAKQGEGR